MFRHAAALEVVERGNVLLRDLRQHGAFALKLAPGRLATGLINQYLEIKEQSLL